MTPRVRRALATTVAAVVVLDVVQLVFRPPVELLSTGVANGALYGLTAVGIILVYRNNRIINFAAAGLGAVPGVLAALLVSRKGVEFFLALGLALVGSAAMGAATDVVVIRRFERAPRLILTVITLGVVQTLAFVTIYIPIWMGTRGVQASTVATPFGAIKISLHGRTVITGAQIFAVAVVLALCAGLAAFVRLTRTGIAMRASAENLDRALLLAIPVRVVGTVAWAAAGLFAGTTIFLRSTLIGIPFDGSLGFSVLLYALAAAVVGRMERIGTALLAGIGVGVLEQASVARTGSPDLTTAIMLAVILLALLAQRGSLSRAADSGLSASSLLRDFRPIRSQLRALPEVAGARYGLFALVGVAAIAAPWVLGPGDIGALTLLPIFGIVAVSLVVLTGWGGQISLGQMGIVGAAAAVAGGLAANHNIDATVAVAVGVLTGAGIAVLVGLPAVRIQGLYLAVTTMSFAGAAQYWLLKSGYPVADLILPSGDNPRILRPSLWQRVDLENDRTYYLTCLLILLAIICAAQAFKRSRSGRVFLAVRDNSRAAPAYAVNVVRTRLTAFALSGAIAGLAGVLLVYQQRAFDAETYGIGPSVQIFVATVIGGLSSIAGAVTGAVLLEAFVLFGHRLDPITGPHLARLLPLLLTGPLLIVSLRFHPGGSIETAFTLRDRFVRWVARRRLDAGTAGDVVVDDEDGPDVDAVSRAAEHGEAVVHDTDPSEPVLVGAAAAAL